MAVCVRIVVGRVVGKAVGLWPRVFTVVVSRPTADFRIAGVAVHVEDIAGVVRVFVCQIEDIPRVGAG